MSGPRTTTVHISKADHPETGGESIQEFSRRVRDAARAHMVKKLKLKGDFDVFPVDIFPEAAVIEVMQFGKNQPHVRKLLSLPFTSSSDGGFEFGEPTPVRRRVSYVAVTKGAPSFWDTLSG